MLLSFSAPADNSYRHIVSLCLTVHFICLFGLKSGVKLGRSRKLSPFGSVPHSAPHPYPPITSLRCAPRLVDVIMLHLSRGQTFSSLRHLEHIHLPEVTEKPPLSLPPPHPRAQAPRPGPAPQASREARKRTAGRGSGQQEGEEGPGGRGLSRGGQQSCVPRHRSGRRSRRGPLRCGP